MKYKFACTLFNIETMQNDQIVIYKTENGETAIDVKLVNDTIWLTQYQLAELFETDRTSLNEKRLKEQNEQLNSLKNAVTLLSNVIENKSLNNDEATGLLKVVTDYAYALDILDKYDHQELTIEGTTVQELFVID